MTESLDSNNVRDHDPAHELFATVLPYVNFLDIALACHVKRAIIVSSGSTVYGDPQVLPIPEQHSLHPISPYGIAKVAIENYCGFYKHDFGLDTRILRVANVYGLELPRFGGQVDLRPPDRALSTSSRTRSATDS